MLTCPLHWLTGLDCPFCGVQRMALALLHGNVAEAFWFNPGFAVGVPLVGLWWLWQKASSAISCICDRKFKPPCNFSASTCV